MRLDLTDKGSCNFLPRWPFDYNLPLFLDSRFSSPLPLYLAISTSLYRQSQTHLHRISRRIRDLQNQSGHRPWLTFLDYISELKKGYGSFCRALTRTCFRWLERELVRNWSAVRSKDDYEEIYDVTKVVSLWPWKTGNQDSQARTSRNGAS